jgi:hypothetical protein
VALGTGHGHGHLDSFAVPESTLRVDARLAGELPVVEAPPAALPGRQGLTLPAAAVRVPRRRPPAG